MALVIFELVAYKLVVKISVKILVNALSVVLKKLVEVAFVFTKFVMVAFENIGESVNS